MTREMGKGIKLTKPQKDLLASTLGRAGVICSSSYSPCKKLIELGLVTLRTAKLGTEYITITQAGKDALK
jgi:hypothetical protein